MTNTSHTPGPWRVNGHVIEIPRMGLVVATATPVRTGFAPRTESEASANARLIAASPDLLAALEAIIHEFCHPEPEYYGHTQREQIAARDEALANGRAAIAKAKGEPQ